MAYSIERVGGWREFLTFRRDRLVYIADGGRRSIDIRIMKFGSRELVHLNHPELIQDVLITHDWNFTKGLGLKVSKPILGEGLLTSEGELHRRQRRLAQPAFNHARLASYARVMVECAGKASTRWKSDQTIDVHAEMMRLTLDVVGRTLFSADVMTEDNRIGQSLQLALRAFTGLNSPMAFLIPMIRRRAQKRAARFRLEIEKGLRPVIDEHRRNLSAYDDMLSMLMQPGEDANSGYMSEKLLLDETLTLFLAGHETTAVALTWTWYLLAQHPEVLAQLQAELEAEPAGLEEGKSPMEWVPRLRYTGWVVREAMRLYPPAWIIGRTVETPYRVGEIEVPAGVTLLVSPFATQHDPRFWTQPESFKPERWGTEAVAGRHRFTWFPFGAGTRVCIGEQFAMMEAVLLLATLARHWRFELVSPGQTVEMSPQVTLRPKGAVTMRAVSR
jgi:cytochrome P450